MSKMDRIGLDVESLSYDDYGEFATYEDKTNEIANDLIIEDGKFVWQISRTSNGEYENIKQIECMPMFESELDLMIQMGDVLDKYIKNEKDFKIKIQYGGINNKIRI